ncbi:MAG: diguanylate cyclase [Mycobacterium sp.]
MRELRSALTWLNAPDQFEEMTTFLQQRTLLRSAQVIMAVVGASSSLIPISNLATQQLVSGRIIALSAVSAVFTLGMTAFWLTRWPTRRQSEVLTLAGAVFIAVWSGMQSSPGVAALACSALAVTGGYLAFFHNPRSLLMNAAIAVTAAVFAASRLADETDLATAFAAFWIVWFMNLSVPVAIHGMSQAMGMYATRADEDGLTGLLNRRSFSHALQRMLTDPNPAASQLTVILADIDDFKRINDTFGHAEGDRVIRVLADLLRRHCPSHAAICRAGGEEFLIALTAPEPALPLAHELCAAIADLPDDVTASIGVACVDLTLSSNADGATALAHLFADADTAMYAAKRTGGNTVRLAV